MRDQTMIYEGFKYSVMSLIGATKDHEVRKAKLDTLNKNYYSPCDNSLLSFVEHMRQVNKANLKYPIIIAENGNVLDGQHRIAKALLTGENSIPYVLIKNDELPPYIEEIKK